MSKAQAPRGAVGLPCPRCSDGQVVVRKTKEDERTFYGCHRYPACDFASSLKPLKGKCPECSTPYLVEKVTKMGIWEQCPDKKCGWKKKRAASS